MKKDKLVGFIILIIVCIALIRTPIFWVVVSIIAVLLILININHKNQFAELQNAFKASEVNDINISSQMSLNDFIQMQNDNLCRILSDSANIVSNTKDLSTFFSRFSLIIDKGTELARNNKRAIEFIKISIMAYPDLLNNCVERCLSDAYNLKTNKGKINRIQKIVSIIENEKSPIPICQKSIDLQTERLKNDLVTLSQN